MIQAGARVGEYVLEAKVGGGAFGEVWRAHHHVWADQLVAAKIPTDPQYLRNLQRESSVIHGLVHPNIVRALGTDPFAPIPYLTMEYVPGSSLRPLIQARSITIPSAIAILRQILTGLQYAHEHNIIHRDIKPENILIHERAAQEGYAQGVVKITDFGLGRVARISAGSIAYSTSINDPAGREIAGTLDYMAPEQRGADPGDVDGRCDLYACGVVLYEMLTGERPAGTEVPSDLNRAVPRGLDDVFRRSYARREKRFASAADFLAALDGSVSRISAPGAPPPLPQNPRSFNGSACPNCRKPVDPADQFCMHCGIQLVNVVRRCPRCGAFPDRNDQFCIFCGEGLASQAALA